MRDCCSKTCNNIVCLLVGRAILYDSNTGVHEAWHIAFLRRNCRTLGSSFMCHENCLPGKLLGKST
jgi:hypothetical protein